MNTDHLDEDAVVACADLVGRSGATGFECGYLHDDVPAEEAGWYAHAQYRGARLTTEGWPGPVEACDALARRVLSGGTCQHCGGTVTLSGPHKQGKRCRWKRMGDRWERGCI